MIDKTRCIPILNEDNTGSVANDMATCDILASTYHLLMPDNAHLARPIGIAIAT